MVANAVTLRSISALLSRQKTYGGELCTIAISEMEQLGKSQILQPKLPVTQWVVSKPFEGNAR
jgi:precorrin-6Y C5,15-methyltransferase (decarboxylating)